MTVRAEVYSSADDYSAAEALLAGFLERQRLVPERLEAMIQLAALYIHNIPDAILAEELLQEVLDTIGKLQLERGAGMRSSTSNVSENSGGGRSKTSSIAAASSMRRMSTGAMPAPTTALPRRSVANGEGVSPRGRPSVVPTGAVATGRGSVTSASVPSSEVMTAGANSTYTVLLEQLSVEYELLRLRAYELLGALKATQGQQSECISLLQQCHAGRLRVLGAEHRLTSQAATALEAAQTTPSPESVVAN